MQNKERYILILLLFSVSVFCAYLFGKDHRSDQVINLQQELRNRDIFINNTREALINSNLSDQMIDSFNRLEWKIPKNDKK